MAWEDRRDRIERDGPVTVWRQIADDLTAEMESGELPPGSRLPSEAELADIYGVARLTVRRAIRDLAERKLVTVVQGRGTFVRQR